MIIELVNAILNNKIDIIKNLILYNKKELYNTIIENIYIFYIKNIDITIYKLLLYFLDNNIIIIDLNYKIIKLLILNGYYKHLSLNRINYEKLFNIIDCYFNKEILINDHITFDLISKFLIIHYNYYNHDYNYIKYIYNYIKYNLDNKYMLFFCKKIMVLSYGYNNHDYLYYCYGFENDLFDWCIQDNKKYLIKYLMIDNLNNSYNDT